MKKTASVESADKSDSLHAENKTAGSTREDILHRLFVSIVAEEEVMDKSIVSYTIRLIDRRAEIYYIQGPPVIVRSEISEDVLDFIPEQGFIVDPEEMGES